MRKSLLFLLSIFCAITVMAQPTVYNWVPQSISPGNNLQELKQMDDNSLITVGYNNSFLKSVDNGQSWNQVKVIDAGFDFTSLSISSSGAGLLSSRYSRIIDYKTGEDVYLDGILLRTTDFGATWSIMDLSGIGAAETDLDPNKLACFRLDLFTVECIDADHAFVYGGWQDISIGTKVSNGAIYETTDAGATWKAVSGNLGNSGITAIQTSGVNTYIAGNNTLYKKSGENFTDIYPALVTANSDDASIYIFDIDVVSESELYIVTTTDGLFHTTDGGLNFTELSGTGVPTGGNDIKVIDENTIMVLGIAAKSKVTVDGGANWVNCYPGVSCWEISGVFNDFVYATTKDDIYKIAVSDLTTAPTNWIKQNITDLGVNIQQIQIIDTDKAILAGYGELVKSTSDNGQTWIDVSLPELYTPCEADAEYEFDFKGICSADGVSYASTRRFFFVDNPTASNKADLYFPGLIFMSSDNWETSAMLDLSAIGAENEADATKNPFHANCYGFEPYTIDCITDSVLLVWAQWIDTTASYADKVTHSALFRTSNNGTTWSIVTEDLGSPFVNDIHFIDSELGYVAGSKTLLKTTDGGKTFVNLYPALDSNATEDMFINSIYCVSAEEIYLTTVADNVWLTTDGGTSFSMVPGIAGCNGFIKLSDTHFLALGTSSKSFLTWTGGEKWEVCYPGSSIWSIGGIFDNSVFALAKGDIYKIPVAELLNAGVGIKEISNEGSIKILNSNENVEILSTGKVIDRCVVYGITGNIVESREVNSESCVFNKSVFAPGVYIIATYSGNKRYTNKLIF